MYIVPHTKSTRDTLGNCAHAHTSCIFFYELAADLNHHTTLRSWMTSRRIVTVTSRFDERVPATDLFTVALLHRRPVIRRLIAAA